MPGKIKAATNPNLLKRTVKTVLDENIQSVHLYTQRITEICVGVCGWMVYWQLHGLWLLILMRFNQENIVSTIQVRKKHISLILSTNAQKTQVLDTTASGG